MNRPSVRFAHHWLVPPLAAAVLHGVFQYVADVLFGVTLQPVAIPADLAFHCVAALVLRALSRNTPVFLALLTVLMGVVHLGNAMKIAILGGPIMPDDMASLRSLLLLLEGGWLALALGAFALLVALLGAALTLKPLRARWAAAGVAALATVVSFAPGPLVMVMDRQFGNVVWDQHANYGWRGPLVHLLQESARHSARSDAAPPRGEVLAAVDTLAPALQPVSFDLSAAMRQSGGEAPARNVHMIVLESFWDPMALQEAGFSADPFVMEFRALWEAAGRSRVLSPVFGGYTANAEFEALCGFPVMEDAVFFEGRLRQDAPCLPRLLGMRGYRTIASHPNVAVFWNRVHAYRRVGFDTYWSEGDFELDDMNGSFLGDASLYRQVLGKLSPLMKDGGAPVFNYVLTFFGHLDYPLNESRPSRITTRDGDERLELYANTVHYKSLELMYLLAELRARDPDALVVVFGDHLPFLGPNFEHYVQSGVLARARSDFDDHMFIDAHATPLLVIDGERGPLGLGDLPLYHLPAVILELLGEPVGSTAMLTRHTAGFQVRPLPGMHVVQGGEGTLAVCRGEPHDPLVCLASSEWLAAVRTLATDLFSGRQHLLRGDPMPPPTAPAPFRGPLPVEGRTAALGGWWRPPA